MFDIFEVNEFLDACGVISVENLDGPSEEFWLLTSYLIFV